MCLRGQAATEIVALYHHINGVLACPLLFGPEGAACEGAQQRPAFYRELFPQLRRARAMLREVMAGLRYSGALQATFASIVRATRFKFFMVEVSCHPNVHTATRLTAFRICRPA